MKVPHLLVLSGLVLLTPLPLKLAVDRVDVVVRVKRA